MSWKTHHTGCYEDVIAFQEEEEGGGLSIIHNACENKCVLHLLKLTACSATDVEKTSN